MSSPRMPRRTISISQKTDQLVRDLAGEDESFSATVTRLIEAGAKAAEGARVPSYVGSGTGPADLSARAEDYLREIFSEEEWTD